MRSIFYCAIGFIALICYSFIWSTETKNKNWQLIHAESVGPITFSLQLKPLTNLADSSWISIEVLNETGEPLQISNVKCEVALTGFNEKGKIVSEGFFESVNANDIFNLPSSPNPFEETKLPEGLSSESNRMSTLCGTILGFTKTPLKVTGELTFFLELQGKYRYFIAPEKIEFEFFWSALNDSDINTIVVDCKNKLKHPSHSTFEVHRLSDLLSIPGIENSLSADELLTGLALRRNIADGRQAIATVLAKSFSGDKLVRTYYEDHVNGQDYRILEDLKMHPALWSKQFLTPMISWLATANNSTKFRILETFYAYRSDWEKKAEIVEQLSAIIESNFGEIIKAQPHQLDQRELVSWAAAAQLWSFTADKKAIEYLIPFLSNNKAILGSELLLDHNSYNRPRPTRVNEVAIESILKLEGKDLDKVYKDAGFKPPYLYGEAPIIIEKIRKRMIQDWTKKNASTKNGVPHRIKAKQLNKN